VVSGATGFLGRHLVRALIGAGHQVRAVVRRESLSLEWEGAQLVRGDVLDPETLEAACEGADVVYHLAGRVQHKGEPTALYQLHVEGTRNMLAAAAGAGAQRFVHLSSSGTIAVGTQPQLVHDETAPYAIETARRWPYYLSKIFAEKLALEAHARGQVPVVVLNPSLLLGPEDETLASSQVILRFLRQEVPMVPPGGINMADVRDVADAAVKAATQGRDGERYLLGGPNMTLEAFFVLLAKVTGKPAPTLRASSGLNRVAGQVIGALEDVGGLEGDESVAYEMAGHYWYLDARKAQSELDFQARPPEQTLRDAVAWIRSQGPIPTEEGTMGSLVRGFKRLLGQA
jgi:dihydroflavonol-4-reductase